METEPRWYQFKDQERKEIVSSFSNPQPEQPNQGPVEKLPENDPRVQEYLGPIWSRSSYQRFTIENIEDLFLAYRLCSMNPKFGFRGQANYDLPLLTCIERNRDKILQTEIGLGIYQQRVLAEAKRRAHYYLTNAPEENDTMGWLALLRHFGVPTQLLDITWSIFIAAYFAIEQQIDTTDACIWAFNHSRMDLNLHRIIINNSSGLFLQRGGQIFLDNYQPPTFDFSKALTSEKKLVRFEDIMMHAGGPDINLLFNLALEGALAIEGLIFIEPNWLNKRMDVQQGAFLVPLRLQTGFMNNLFASGNFCNQDVNEKEEKTVSSILSHPRTMNAIQQNASVIKFRIKSSLKKELRAFLHAANINKLTIYPDVEGFFGYLSDLIPSGKIFES